MRCAITQPTFLPWLGWFDLADQVDTLVLLDDVGFSKQSWQQRNRIRTRDGLEFISVPVKTAGRLGQRICDCELVHGRFADTLIKTLRTNYGKAPHFADAIDGLSESVRAGVETGRRVELNCALISWLAGRLGVTTPMTRATALGVSGQRGEHVAAICDRLGAREYLSPVGAEAYLREDRRAFENRGISVSLQEFEHPAYSQRFAPFLPFASALDLVFNLGPAAPQVMRSGRRASRPLAAQAPARAEEI